MPEPEVELRGRAPRWGAACATAIALCVLITMFGATGVVQAVCGRGGPGAMSTRHSRHAPTGSSLWW